MAREPVGERWVHLGGELRRIRNELGRTTSRIPKISKPGKFFSDTQISLVERGLARASQEIIQGYVAVGGDRETLHALYAEAKGVNQSALHMPSGGGSGLVTPASVYDDIRRQYEIEDSEESYRFDACGIVAEFQKLVTIKAVQSGVRYFVGVQQYLAERRRGIFTLEAGAGCTVARQSETDAGVLDFVLELDQSLNPDDGSYSFTYKFIVEASVQTEPILRWESPGHVRRKAVRVQFTPPAFPQSIWIFRSSNFINTEVARASEQSLKPSPYHFYYYNFLDLHQEFYGLAWKWPEDVR